MTALLTVDDVPSRRFAEKLDFLTERRLPAVLFCWGEKIRGYEPLLVEALQRGFALANHSWTHPHFSTLTLAQARDEILQTEAALVGLHALAGVPWEKKYFRFPYLDKGGERAAEIQRLLLAAGYTNLNGGGGADSGCTFDQKEYHYLKSDAPDGLSDEAAILARIQPGLPGPGDTILIHDHEETHDIFFRCIELYLQHGLRFGKA